MSFFCNFRLSAFSAFDSMKVEASDVGLSTVVEFDGKEFII